MPEIDDVLEKAAIKSWLILNHMNIKKNRDKFFTISVLSVLLAGGKECKSDDELYREYKEWYGHEVDIQKVKNELNKLEKCGVIQKKDNNRYFILKKPLEIVDEKDRADKDEINAIALEVVKRCEEISKQKFVNIEQLRVNICNCIHYYFRSSCHAMIGVDRSQDINQMPKIQEILEVGLKSKAYDFELIIGELGSILTEPAHSKLYESLARKYFASQIVGTDPMLRNFKESVMSSKIFVLDTDTALSIMAVNTRQGKVYMNMLNDLRNCGCTIYLPDKVIEEIFHHAEAAGMRYSYVTHLMDCKDETVSPLLQNLFVEDYYYLRRETEGKSLKWEDYLANIYNEEHGVAFTSDVVRDFFGGKVKFGLPDNTSEVVNDNDLAELTELVYDVLVKTKKGTCRDDSLNHEMARTDAYLYLMTNGLNGREAERNRTDSSQSKLLRERYYVISGSHRAYYCAKTIGKKHLKNVTCNPKALIMILSEIGISKGADFRMMDVLDNPLISKVAQVIEDDLSNLHDIGIDFSGKNLVSLRYSLHDSVEEMLTHCKANEYDKVVEIARQKKVEIRPEIQSIIDQRNEGLIKVEELKRQLEDKDRQISELSRQREQEKKEIAKNEYLRRAYRRTSTKGKTKYK